METKDNVINLNDYKRNRQKAKEDELEQTRYALFMQQHSDDDTFENHNEFTFTDD